MKVALGMEHLQDILTVTGDGLHTISQVAGLTRAQNRDHMETEQTRQNTSSHGKQEAARRKRVLRKTCWLTVALGCFVPERFDF